MWLKPKFESLVKLHSTEIVAFLWRMTGDMKDAEDCLQETFLRAFRAYPRLGSKDNYRAWIYKIASNVARTFLKRRRRVLDQTTDVDPSTVMANPGALEDLDQRSRLAAVAAAVNDLPYKQRAAFIMRKYQGLRYDEVASTLGGSEASARANVYQALKKLRARFTPVPER
jgi:RNA polymerase sigma-70 factor (ECF subfamily)